MLMRDTPVLIVRKIVDHNPYSPALVDRLLRYIWGSYSDIRGTINPT